MAYNIGFFTKTDNGFTGKIETLALKAQADFHRVTDRTNKTHPPSKSSRATSGSAPLGNARARRANT
jgi:uncharacterized protein (DUF736 family)